MVVTEKHLRDKSCSQFEELVSVRRENRTHTPSASSQAKRERDGCAPRHSWWRLRVPESQKLPAKWSGSSHSERVCRREFFFLRIKIETEVATNEQQVFRINFLYILEMFASVFNSQEAIVFLQSLAQKFLGSFLRTGNGTHISFTPLPRKTYPLHVLVEYENVWLTGCWFENMSQRLVSAFNPSLQNGAEKNCVWMSGSHTGASSRMWAKHQASHRLEDTVVQVFSIWNL